MLPKEQAESIKKQLLSQIEGMDIPNKEETKKQISSMNPEQLEQFLKQNNIQTSEGQSQEQKCIFCSIAFNEMPSYKISEDESAVAVLELNPISKGHVLIIPKEHSEKVPEKASKFAEEISKTLKTKLSPKDIVIQNSSMFGHEILNIIPIYNNENINSPRKKIDEKELLQLQKLLEIKKKSKSRIIKKPKVKKITKSQVKKLWLPKRIP